MKKFSFLQHLLQVLVSALALSNLHQCGAIRLNSNGGYDIVIGIEDNTMEPLNSKEFLEEIRMGIDQFSMDLWRTTHRRFFINSVDVLVPANWWTVNNFYTATWQTLLGSEIRIAHDVGAPNVVNPNSCGTPGLYIEVPDKFFKTARGGQYGPVGKALVNLWARYRFGVWEEHGIPGDTNFPYFYAHPSLEPKWEATGCASQEISGTFQDIDGEISPQCDPYRSETLDDNCRFIPSPLNTANSSLMHLHWLDSITEFCDSKTHNHVAPNRQNLFCGHRSVWEVIRESDDYKSTKSCTENVPRPQFRVLKESRSPELYVLLDKGRTNTEPRVLQEVMGALVRFVSTASLEQINIAVGTYPHANQGKNHYYVKEEIGWAPIHDVIYDVERVFADYNDTTGPVIRDFGLAIQEVAEKIKQRNHLAGTIILVIKRGATPNLFDKISFEQEVIASVKEDSRIKVFAIEAQQGDQAPFTNLQSLVQATAGKYHLINETQHVAKKLEKLLGAAQEKLEQSSIMNSVSSWTTQKQYTDPDSVIEIPIYDNVNAIQIHLTTHNKMVASDIYLEPITEEGELRLYDAKEKVEWDESSDLSRRIVFTYTIKTPKPGSLWTLRHGCHSDKSSDCRFFLIVTAHIDNPSPRVNELESTEMEMIFNSQVIDIDVSTSATEFNFVDMSHQGFKVVPFSIYAKIEMMQQRILGLENVTALVRLGGQHDNHLGDWIIPLFDDGRGVPDIAERDGIYSGVFTPPENGLYQISVTASGVSQPGGSSFQDMKIVNHPGSLMQVSQQSFGCKNSSKPRCVSAVPRGSFSRVKDIQRTVAVENALTFMPGKPTRILDFTVTPLPNYTIICEFTSPRLLGSDDDPEDYNIYMAPHVDNFIGSTDMTKLLMSARAEPVGSKVSLRIVLPQERGLPYFAVETTYRGQKSGPSNVVGAMPSEYGPVLPSPTTTPGPTTSPPSTTTDSPTTTLSPTTGSTSSTEFPWPSTSPTTESSLPTTTDESEEDWPTESPTTTESSVTTTQPSSTTTSPIPTDDNGGSTGFSSTTSSTEAPTSTTQDDGLTGSVPVTSTTTETPSTTTEDGVTSSSSTTTESPTSTTEGSVTSTTTEESVTSTTEGTGTSTTTSTTEIPISSTTTESSVTTTGTSSTTLSPTETTTEDPEVTSTSSTTTIAPSTTSENPGTSTSTTTELPSTTTDESATSTSTTTESPTSSSTSTLSPTTTEAGTSTTSTTEDPTSTNSPSTSSPSTTENPTTTNSPSSSTTPDPGTSSTTEEDSPTGPPGSPSTASPAPSTSTSTNEPPTSTISTTTERDPPPASSELPSTSSSTSEQGGQTTPVSENRSSSTQSSSTFLLTLIVIFFTTQKSFFY